MMMSSEQLFCTLPVQTFTRRKHSDARKLTFSAFSVGVEFYRLLKPNSATIIPHVSNWDLLNTVIALFDVCLPDIGVEVLRSTVCAQGAKTILLLRDHQEVLKEYQDNLWPKGPPKPKPSPTESKNEEENESTFSAVFSDSESTEEEDDSDSDQEESKRFHSSLEEFLSSLTERRHQRRQPNFTIEAIGFECCIVAALTYKKSASKSKEKIIEVSLLSTRRRYRGCGAARYMLQLLKDVSLVGFYDAIVTHADSRAIELFASCDFSDDIILNSRFRDLAQDWTNTTTMSYFPPFSLGQASHLDTEDLEAEMTQWREKSMAAHEAQAIFMRRILQEIKALRKQVKSQKYEILKLTADLENERREKKLLQNKVFEHQIIEIEKIAALQLGEQKENENDMPVTLQDIAVKEIEVEGQKLVLEEIFQTALSWQDLEEVKTYLSKLHDTGVHQRLYYCDRRSQLVEILNRGFSPKDVQQREYGNGIYFSTSPAAAISTAHHVLVADVYVGRIQTNGNKSASRRSSPSGFDSIQIRGRWSTEFVIFSHLQAIPICLLKYTKRDSPTENTAVSK
ncbi:uncharacterized protein LOC120917656 [Rana temporaria]|uniref:uncharacterized protein LOC120917656 n=1 Tax=Rana temporaria TaxID=8407 RepID=UPI001AAC5D2B|nr:uncharacterized protein LOC120917656 [Rana temporaria]